MKCQAEMILKDELELSNGIVYAVPKSWWDQFCAINFDTTKIQDLQIPKINIQNFVDSFILDFSDSIIQQVDHKCNYLKFSRSLLSPQPRKDVEWKIVSPAFWKRVNTKQIKNQAVLLNYELENPRKWLEQQKKQIQFVFCSKERSQIFVGYFPQGEQFVQLLRKVGYEMGFIQMENSKIMFLDKVVQKVYQFHQLEKIKLKDVCDTLIMAYNMEKNNQQYKEQYFTFGDSEKANKSNQAVIGQLGLNSNDSLEHMRIDRTMSTGAQTPSFLWSEDGNNEDFRVRQIFRQKKPQQIQQMKNHAEQCMKGDLIYLPNMNQEEMNSNLTGIVQQIYDHLNLHKKKNHKDKEIFQ